MILLQLGPIALCKACVFPAGSPQCWVHWLPQRRHHLWLLRATETSSSALQVGGDFGYCFPWWILCFLLSVLIMYYFYNWRKIAYFKVKEKWGGALLEYPHIIAPDFLQGEPSNRSKWRDGWFWLRESREDAIAGQR